jgi:hypothetical protein
VGQAACPDREGAVKAVGQVSVQQPILDRQQRLLRGAQRPPLRLIRAAQQHEALRAARHLRLHFDLRPCLLPQLADDRARLHRRSRQEQLVRQVLRLQVGLGGRVTAMVSLLTRKGV